MSIDCNGRINPKDSVNIKYLENMVARDDGIGVRGGVSIIGTLGKKYKILRLFKFKAGGITQDILHVAEKKPIELKQLPELSKNSKTVYTSLYNDESIVQYKVQSVEGTNQLKIDNKIINSPYTGYYTYEGQILSYINSEIIARDGEEKTDEDKTEKLVIPTFDCFTYVNTKNHLILANGLGPMIYWDGKKIKVLFNVFILCEGVTKINGVALPADISPAKYFAVSILANNLHDLNLVLRPGTRIRLKDNRRKKTYYNGTIYDTKMADYLSLIIRPKDPKQLSTLQMQVSFEKIFFLRGKAPKLSHIFLCKNRIFGFIAHEANMTIYFTLLPNNDLMWSLPAGGLCYIDLSFNYNKYDFLQSIVAFGNKILFFCGKHIQIWSGFNPNDPVNFRWNNNIDIGLFDSRLLAKLPNDIVFVSINGIERLSKSSNQSGDIFWSEEHGIKELMRYYTLKYVNSSNNRKTCSSVICLSEDLFGFKLGNSPLFITSISNKMLNLWSAFTGLFQFSNSFFSDDTKLFFVNKNNVYMYNGLFNNKKYTDNGDPIKIYWKTKAIKLNNPLVVKWVNPVLKYNYAFHLKRFNKIQMFISKDITKENNIIDIIPVDKGDVMGSRVLNIWHNDNGLHFPLDNKHTSISLYRIRLSLLDFTVMISGDIIDSDFKIEGIKLLGY